MQLSVAFVQLMEKLPSEHQDLREKWVPRLRQAGLSESLLRELEQDIEAHDPFLGGYPAKRLRIAVTNINSAIRGIHSFPFDGAAGIIGQIFACDIKADIATVIYDAMENLATSESEERILMDIHSDLSSMRLMVRGDAR